MAYIGQRAAGTTAQSRTLDTMTGDGSTNTLTLSQTPDSVMNVTVYYDGVMQRPDVEYTLSGNTLTFTTAPESGVVVYAMTGGAEDIGSPMADSVTLDTIVDNAITNNKIVSMSSNKLTGALPALDGSNLTGFSSTIDTKSTNDPAIDTNPSAVGHLWANTTSGEMFVCTDNTAGANVWYNIGGGSGDIQKFDYRGESFGYNSGGSRGAPSNIIDKQSFTSDGNATDVADLSQSRYSPAGTHSSTHSYAMGGLTPSIVDTIDKFPFASETNATDVGNLSVGKAQARGQSNDTYIYCSGGYNGGSIELTHVEKRTTSSDGDMTNVLSLTVARRPTAEASSETEGFNAGGEGDGAANLTVDKFSFANDNDATDHGDLTFTHADASGGQSDTHGFSAGGHSVRTIQRYAFSSNTTATDWGDLLNNSSSLASGTSSLSHVYMAGGVPSGSVNVIQKYATSTPSNATDVGDLTVAGYSSASSQV